MNLQAAVGRPPLVLLVDPVVASRHFMWRALSRSFGVIEAVDAAGARSWIARRPDIDALVVQDELPDQRGLAFVHDLATAEHPVARRAIVLVRAALARRDSQGGLTLLDPRDVPGLLVKLASWFLGRDAALAAALMREAHRLS